MTSTVRTGGAQAPSAPEFPMPRAEGCPFDPPPALKKEQEQGPLRKVRLWDGTTPWLVTRYADQRALLADPRTSADITRPGYPSSAPVRGSSVSFILMDDPEHARQRRMVTAPFTIKRVEAMRPAVQKIVDGLIEDMLAGPPRADLVQAFALPVPSLVICELLGVPYADHDFFQENSKILISRSAAPEERGAAHAKLIGYLDELMGHKIARPADDLLSGLGTRVGAGELSRREAAETGVLLLVAGHETTANMIALGTLALLQHPDQVDALRATGDPARIAAAVEELLRYLSIVQSGRRRVALADIPVGGQTIRAGEGVILATEAANRDASVFGDPDRLDVDRDARGHMAFGFGVHQCLCQPLARVELQVAFGTLFRRIPTLRPAVRLEEIP